MLTMRCDVPAWSKCVVVYKSVGLISSAADRNSEIRICLNIERDFCFSSSKRVRENNIKAFTKHVQYIYNFYFAELTLLLQFKNTV